jgi:hypothetical protein
MDAEPEDDPTLKALMEESFGPPGNAPADSDRIARGLDQVDRLSSVEGSPDEPAVAEWLFESSQAVRPSDLGERRCFACSATVPTAWCGRCGVAGYCNKACQTADWGKRGAWGGHKGLCDAYKALGKSQAVANGAAGSVLARWLAKLRLYLCPFAVCHGAGACDGSERGFVFLNLGCSVSALALPAPRDCAGRRLEPSERSAMLTFLTLDLFDCTWALKHEALRDKALHTALKEALAGDDSREHVIVLLVTACGHLAVARVPMVPAFPIARQLASEYADQQALHFDLDEIT